MVYLFIYIYIHLVSLEFDMGSPINCVLLVGLSLAKDPVWMLGSSFGSCWPPVAQSFWQEQWRAAPTCWCWLWWHAPLTCCCPVRASPLLRCCVAVRSTRLEPWHRPPLSRLRAVPCRWAWPQQVANLRGFLWSSLASWRAPRLLASWLSSSTAPTPVPAAVSESLVFLFYVEEPLLIAEALRLSLRHKKEKCAMLAELSTNF